MKSMNLNFLEPSGPLQACNGIILPLFTSIIIIFQFSNLSPPSDFYRKAKKSAPEFFSSLLQPHFSS